MMIERFDRADFDLPIERMRVTEPRATTTVSIRIGWLVAYACFEPKVSRAGTFFACFEQLPDRVPAD
ncbi:MAG: hypothetical protein ACODAD_05250 [Planctomycetota bacterium]